MQQNEIPDFLNEIIDFARLQSYPRGTCLIASGQPADCFYFIESGTCEVSYAAQGTKIVVALIGAGNFFGEIGYFDNQPRTRNIDADSDVTVRVFDAASMAAIKAHDQRLHAKLMEHLLRLVCHRFWQVLSDRGPLAAYAASLSTGRDHFQGLQTLPPDLLASHQWLQINSQIEDFKAALFDLTYRLQQCGASQLPDELIHEGESLLTQFNGRLRQFEQDAMAPESANLMWGYVFKELFPYFMRSRFAERAYYKPKGYAGDFMMMELIYRQKPDGDGILGSLIDGWLLKQAPAQAVRNRRHLLHRMLDEMMRTILKRQDAIAVINLACGPARELADLLDTAAYSSQVRALCIDIDPEALTYADRILNNASHDADVRFMKENIVKWALGRAKHDLGAQDIIYSSGLCDYLDERLVIRLISRCHDQLKPGGFLILGNFAPENPDRAFMDHVLYWRLIHRSQAELANIFHKTPFGQSVRFESEDQGVNVFAIATKAA